MDNLIRTEIVTYTDKNIDKSTDKNTDILYLLS